MMEIYQSKKINKIIQLYHKFCRMRKVEKLENLNLFLWNQTENNS
jgi:hypothetical protein